MTRGLDEKGAEKGTEQSQRFIEAARELGCDESEERFNEALKKVAKAPAAKQESKPRRSRKSTDPACR